MTEAREQDVVVRLLIFSGRPDPEWPLDEDQFGYVAGLLGEVLGGEPVEGREPAGLGYRGFLLQGLRNLDLPVASVQVFRGVVSEGVGQGREALVRQWRDVAGLEPWLLSQAGDRGLGEALRTFGAEGEARA